ncbi:MAG: hypothetical protein WC254_01420 [Candidatus Woesearchaeota archaeon]|jgi:hypothetical protein
MKASIVLLETLLAGCAPGHLFLTNSNTFNPDITDTSDSSADTINPFEMMYSTSHAFLVETDPETSYQDKMEIGTTADGRLRGVYCFDLNAIQQYPIELGEAICLELDATSGTCHSSYNNKDCNHKLPIEVNNFNAYGLEDVTTATWSNSVIQNRFPNTILGSDVQSIPYNKDSLPVTGVYSFDIAYASGYGCFGIKTTDDFETHLDPSQVTVQLGILSENARLYSGNCIANTIN